MSRHTPDFSASMPSGHRPLAMHMVSDVTLGLLKVDCAGQACSFLGSSRLKQYPSLVQVSPMGQATLVVSAVAVTETNIDPTSNNCLIFWYIFYQISA